MKASEIARLLEGRLAGKDVEVFNIREPDKATERDVAFVFNAKKFKYVSANAGVIVLKEGDDIDVESTKIYVKDIETAFVKFLYSIYPSPVKPPEDISPLAQLTGCTTGKNVSIGEFTVIRDGTNIGDGTKIFPQVYIGYNVSIGKNCLIYPGVKIYDKTKIGDRCIIHSNVVIGSDGFGFFEKGGKRIKIPQVGNVEIGKDVEIGSGSTIDRSTLEKTIIGDDVKIDNLVHIGHNVEIGSGSVIVAQSGIAGSVKIGKNVIIAGQVGVADHIEIGDDAIVLAKSGVSKDIPPGKIYSGIPARERKRYLKEIALISRLPEVIKKLEKVL